jgi:60 kDa SS-A/Ro ribonucleoprotein
MTRLAVNEALIERMPLGALVRQLGRLTALGLLQPFAPADRVVEALSDRERILKARRHPMALLIALRTDQSGPARRDVSPGSRSRPSWRPERGVLHRVPRGRAHRPPHRPSASMASGRLAGSALTPSEAAAAIRE